MLDEYRVVDMSGPRRIPLGTMQRYNDMLQKAWGALEFELLIQLDGLVLAQSKRNKPSAPKSREAAATPEQVSVNNVEGMKTLFRSLAAKKAKEKEQ